MKIRFGGNEGLSISARLHIGFGLLLVMLGVVGGLGWYQTSRMSVSARQLVDEGVQRVSYTSDMQVAVQDIVIALGDLCKQGDIEDVKVNAERFDKAMEAYQASKKRLLAVPGGGGSAAWQKALKDMSTSTDEEGSLQLFQQLANLGRAGSADPETLHDFYLTQVSGPQAMLINSLSNLSRLMREAMAQSSNQSQADAQRAQLVILGILCVSLAGGLLSAVLISRSITAPLNRAVSLARTVAQGDLSAEVRTTKKDEIGALLNALADMQDALRHLVGDILQCADSIQVASSEVASGNIDLSQRTELAAGNLQQTASSLEELTGAVRQSADSAATANQLASSASRAAHRGGEVVQQVVSSMADISASSRKIADIIGVIDGIAFQTNLLALNAAVEAARAGEQGRGFAVVAGEVRNLAQRAATAAREIKTLIGASVDRVESGTKLVQDAGGTMHEIVSAVQRVTDVIGEITAATAEQSSGIGQVNGAVVQLDQMTQQNAALVEQSAAAAESLREQAGRLNALVGTFQLERAESADMPA